MLASVARGICTEARPKVAGALTRRLLHHTPRVSQRQAAKLDLTIPPVPPIEFEPLPRSLPHRRGLLLLSIPLPPSIWPARLEMASGLLAAANGALKDKHISVNMVYDGLGDKDGFVWKESYSASLHFADGRVFRYPAFTKETLADPAFLADADHPVNTEIAGSPGGRAGAKQIYVCTHGSRDCRCSDRGGPLVDALRKEVATRGLGAEIKIGEIAHVGGHKYAANALLFPTLDMMSNLTVEHAPALLSHLVSDTPSTSDMWTHWRGRMGVPGDVQDKLWQQIDPERATNDQASSVPIQEEATLRFQTFEGEVKEVQGRIGENLLDVGKRHDLPSLEGVCGGNLECATCHLYLKSNDPPPIPESSEEEDDMLGYALGYREGESRLGCQVKVTTELGDWVKKGGVIGLPRF